MARKRKYGEGSSAEVSEHQGHVPQPGVNAPSSPSSRSVAEHEGRVRQPGVPVGPRQTYVPTSTSTVAEVAGPPNVKAIRHQKAATRQKHLVNEFVTKAYKQKVSKIKSGETPSYEIQDRIQKAKTEVSDLRDRLLNHPRIETANAKGKVVKPSGLQKIRKTELQRHAIEGPKGVQHSDLYGLQSKSLQVGTKGLHELLTSTGMEGSVARAEAKAADKRHQESEPSTLETLGYASIGIPGIGLGADAARLAEVAGSTVPKLLAEGGAKQAAKDIAKGVGESASSKAQAVRDAGAALKSAPKAIKGLPKALREEAPGAIRAGAKAAPRAAGRRGLKSSERTFQGFSALGALGATHKAGLNVPGGAILEGQGKALEHDPGKVLSSTASLAPALLTGAFQLPYAAGKSAVEGNTAPLEGALNEQVNFAKHLADTYGSGDAKKIEKATLEEGLLPEVLAGPLVAKALEKGGSRISERIKPRSETRRAPAMDSEGKVLTHEHGGAVRKGRRKAVTTRAREAAAHRRAEAFHGATTNDLTHLDAAWRGQEIDKHARKAAGKQTVVREGLGPKGKDTLHSRPPDFIPFLARASIDLSKPEAALKEIEHYANLYKGHKSPVEAGINPEGLIARDAVKHFREHPEDLKDPNLQKALDAYRAQSNGTNGMRAISYSDRNKDLSVAAAHDLPFPEHLVPVGAREHTKATTREGAWEDYNSRKATVKELRSEAQKKRAQAQVLDKDSVKGQRLRREAKESYAKAKAIEKDAQALYRELDPFTRPGAKPDYNSARSAYDEPLEKEFSANVAKFKEERGLHPEGVYVPDSAPIIKAQGDQAATGGSKALEGVPKINTGEMWKQGFSRQGYEHLKNEGILRPLHRAHQFENGRRFDTEHSIAYEGEREHTGAGWGKALQHGVVHKEDVVFVPRQVTKRLTRTVQGGENTEYEQALIDAEKSFVRNPDELDKGTVYKAYPRAAWEEFVAQQQKSGVAKALRRANRYTSMAMLSTPAFVGAQAVAETAQGLASVNPVRAAEGFAAYNKLSWDQKLRISAAAGETAKAVFSPEDLQTTLDSYGTKPFADSLSFFRRNIFGRAGESLVKGKAAGEIDRMKGSPIRRATLTGEVLRDINGFRSKARKLFNRQNEIDKAMRGKSYKEQLAYVAEHPDLLAKYQKDLHGMMGGWGNLTRTGHVPEAYRSAALVFYPYLRMSIQWPLKYAQRHPIKATALAYIAAENNFALKEALHGEPSFLNYAQIPTWKEGEDGKPTFDDPVNLSRIAPGGNAITQAVQGSGSLLGAFQPAIAAGVMGLTGQGPLGPVEGGPLAHIEAAGASLLGLSPYLRAADTLAGQKASGQSEFGILAKRANIALDPLAALESKLKGSKRSQVERSLVNPFKPQNLEHVRDQAKLGRILTKLGQTGSDAQNKQQASKGAAKEQKEVRTTVKRMQKENAKAETELENLYAKYGLKKTAARSTEVYEYTHPYPDDEESKSPYEGSGYEGAGYEGTGYGGSKGEAPPKVPQKSDGVGFNLPGLDKTLGAIASPLASLVTGEKASAAELPKGKKETTLTGPLTPGQKTFAKTVAKHTGLNPRVIGAQVLAEESGSAAQQRQAEGNHNWLNIGYFDSGPGSITQDSTWSNPKAAGEATAKFLKGQWGGASPGIQSILSSRGKGPGAQINAIANSGWATNPAYGQSIAGTFRMIGVKKGGRAVPKKIATRFQAGVHAATELNKVNNKGQLPYVWGGGHNPGVVDASGGVDCSGAVSYVLQHMGVKLPGGVTSGEMGHYLKPGPGAVTVFYNPEHTFMKIGNKYFGTSHANPGGGAGYIPTSYEQGEAESGSYQIGHVPGLGKKIALKMGVKIGATGSQQPFPGMTVSSSGTTATINPETATNQKKAGFSNKPIKLTATQRLKQVNQILSGNLTQFGVPAQEGSTPSVSDLAALGAALESERRKLARL